MLDSLLDGLKDQVAGSLAEKVGLDLGQAEKAVPLAGDSIKEGILGAVTDGNVGDVLGMFSSLTGGTENTGDIGDAVGMLSGLTGSTSNNNADGGIMDNMIFKSISNNFIGKLTSNLGLPSGIADSVSNMALPMILGKFKNTVSNDAGELDQGNLLNALGGADSLTDMVKDQALDAVKDKLGGLGKLFG